MKVTLYSISDSDKHFKIACDEYLKRLQKSVTLYDLKPIKYWTQEQIVQWETELIKKKLKLSWQTIILNPLWTNWSTEDRHQNIYGKNTQIVIGWPFGLDYSQFENSTHVSLWSQTMPHGLAKLVLLEQLYRAQCIWQNKKYHY